MLNLMAVLAGFAAGNLLGGAAKGPEATVTEVSNELRVAQYMEGQTLHVVARFRLPNTPFAYGFVGNVTNADYFAAELKPDGTYGVSACVLDAARTPRCEESGRWRLVTAVIDKEELVLTVARDLAAFPVKGFSPIANEMIYSYNLPTAADDEEEEEGERISGTVSVPMSPRPPAAIAVARPAVVTPTPVAV